MHRTFQTGKCVGVYAKGTYFRAPGIMRPVACAAHTLRNCTAAAEGSRLFSTTTLVACSGPDGGTRASTKGPPREEQVAAVDDSWTTATPTTVRSFGGGPRVSGLLKEGIFSGILSNGPYSLSSASASEAPRRESMRGSHFTRGCEGRLAPPVALLTPGAPPSKFPSYRTLFRSISSRRVTKATAPSGAI